MACKYRRHGGRALLEIATAIMVMVLTFQLFPSFWFGLLRTLDVRNWPRGVWIPLNVAILLALIGIRFVPAVICKIRHIRERLAIEREKHEKQRLLQDQRETLERLRQGRARRIY